MNPKAAPSAINEALLKLRNFENTELKKKNALFMDYLQSGIEVSYSEKGESKSDIIYIADFNNPSNNSFIVANQWTFIENSNNRPDILLFLNRLPICLFEIKPQAVNRLMQAKHKLRFATTCRKFLPCLFTTVSA